MRWRAALTAVTLIAQPALASGDVDGHFEATVHPPAPHYAQDADWAIWRGGKVDAPVDLFFIQPTTFVSGRWNQDLADASTNRLTRSNVIEHQTNAFGTCCRIFMPRYRQASTRAFTEMQGDGAKAYALAYHDVRAAFRWYMAHENHGRPYLIVAHSQGSLHALRLLEEEIDGRAAGVSLIAAYAPGVGIPIGTFGTALKTIVPCDIPTRVGCLVSWNSFTTSADVSAFITRSSAGYVRRYGRGAGAELLCVNPLTFAANQPNAPPTKNLGALLAEPDNDAETKFVVNAAGAACKNGVLRIDSSVPLHALPGGILHFYDIPLFCPNLRDNAAIRIRAFVEAHPVHAPRLTG